MVLLVIDARMAKTRIEGSLFQPSGETLPESGGIT